MGVNGKTVLVTGATDPEKFEDVERLAAEVGDLDILFNNAGVFRSVPTHEVASKAFDSTYAPTVKAPFSLTATSGTNGVALAVDGNPTAI